jgi:peptide/nickel transport system substrate-binding protein
VDSKKIFKEKINIFLASTKKYSRRAIAFIRNKVNFFSTFRKNKSKDVVSQEVQDMDKKLVYSLSKSRVPSLRQLKYLKRFLSSREIIILRVCSLLIFTSLLFLGSRFYMDHLQIVPIGGGKYSEALVGSVKHINPLYAQASDVDSDISSLIYSSLFKRTKNGELVNDLVSSYEVSEDALSYTLKLKEGVLWHDESGFSADDVVFTVESIKNKKYESPLRLSLLGVNIEKINNHTVKFTLSEAYSAFLELLTFGILPKNIWSQIPVEYAGLAKTNLNPIGTGPYKLEEFFRKENAGTVMRYNLVANNNYYGDIPKTNINFYLYLDFHSAIGALNNNIVDGISYLPRGYKENIITPKSYNFHKMYLPQLENIFFNSRNNSALGDKAVRQALATAINKNEIINEVLDGSAYIADGPILSNNFAYNTNIKKYDYNVGIAEKLLNSVDWKISEISNDDVEQAKIDLESDEEDLKKKSEKILEVGAGRWRLKQENYFVLYLTVADTEDDRVVAEYVKKYWEAVGVKTVLNIVEAEKIETGVIVHRNFEAILYGQIFGNDPDPYAFWHSSQSDAVGLNFSNFSNEEVDRLLDEARIINNREVRRQKYLKFQEIISEEVPAIFIYSPVYTYVQSNKVKGFDVQNIQSPKNRFSNVHEWYTQVGKRIIW